MGKKLYVGNLSFQTTGAQLQELFASYGQVDSVSIITDRATGQSKGFGFVEMSNNAEAEAAITGLDGKDMGGRAIKVNEAKPQEKRSGGFGGGRGGSGGGGGGYGGGGRSRY